VVRASIIMRSVRESDWKYRQPMNQFTASGKPFSCEECPAEVFPNDPGGAEHSMTVKSFVANL